MNDLFSHMLRLETNPLPGLLVRELLQNGRRW